MYDSKLIELDEIINNKAEIDKKIDPKLKALATALIKKGVITKAEIMAEL